MSIYDNESKIYPDLNPTAPQEPQAYRLKKITEIEAYLLDQIEERRRQAKKNKRFNKIIGIVDIGLITSSAITGGTSIPAFASSVNIPVDVTLGGFSVVLSLSTIVTRKSSRSLTVKQGKHDAIKLLAQAKLDSISNIISQAMEDGDISPTEFHKVLQEVENIANLRLISEARPRPR